jgi:hypothetical protein
MLLDKEKEWSSYEMEIVIKKKNMEKIELLRKKWSS